MITGKFTVDMSPADGLKKSLVNKILRKAVTQAGTPVRQQVKANAQGIARTGGLAKSMGFKLKTYADGVALIIGPKSDYVASKGTAKRRYVPSKIAPLVEKGTKHSKAHPFLLPALQQMQTQFQNTLAALIAEGIAQQLGG